MKNINTLNDYRQNNNANGEDFYRVVTVRNLREINKNSLKQEYNRCIFDWENYVKNLEKGITEGGMSFSNSTKLIVKPWMTHKHKGGQECEEHMRVQITTGNWDTYTEFTIIDMSMRDFNALLTVNETQRLKVA